MIYAKQTVRWCVKEYGIQHDGTLEDELDKHTYIKRSGDGKKVGYVQGGG